MLGQCIVSAIKQRWLFIVCMAAGISGGRMIFNLDVSLVSTLLTIAVGVLWVLVVDVPVKYHAAQMKAETGVDPTPWA